MFGKAGPRSAPFRPVSLQVSYTQFERSGGRNPEGPDRHYQLEP
jgi:hypothetical protein